MSRARWRWLALLSLTAAGCAAHVHAPAGVPARELAQRIGAAEATHSGAASALAIERAQAGRAPRLIAYDVARDRELFRAELEEGAEASAHGDVILIHAGESLRALDGITGQPLYRIALPKGRFAGAARARDRIAIVTVSGRPLDPDARSTLTIVGVRRGDAQHALQLPGDAGRPIGAGDYVFVPTQRQRISVIDVARGVEVARLRAESDAIEWLEVQSGKGGHPALLFGGRRIHRLVAGAAQPSEPAQLPESMSALPGRPSAPHSAYEPRSGRRIGLHVTPVPSGPSSVVLLRDRAYLTFYNLLFAFDGRGELLFARNLPSDVIAARVLDEGLSVALASGELALLSHESGAALASRALTSKGSGGLRSAELPSQALPVDAHGATPRPSLARSLIEAAGAHDARLVPARIYAVERLAQLDDAEITGALLDLYERPNVPAELQSAIATALAERRTGMPALIAALDRRYDFLDGTRPAPLAVIARALARAGERAAAPGLLARLWDHETPATALPSLARALGELGDDEISASLLEWLRLYHADSSLRAEPDALIEVARAAFALDPEGSREQLARLARGPLLADAPRVAIESLIAPPAKVAQATKLAVPAPAAPPRPRLPSQRALDAAFAAQLDALGPCLTAELQASPELRQLRIAFVAEGDGSAHAFHFAPASPALSECLYPKVASIRLPAFTEPRSVEQVVIQLRPADAPADPELAQRRAAPGEDAPWWASQPREHRDKTRATPWWRIEQPLPPRLDEAAGSALDIEAGATTTRTAAPPAPAQAPPAQAPPAPAPEDAWWEPKAQ